MDQLTCICGSSRVRNVPDSIRSVAWCLDCDLTISAPGKVDLSDAWRGMVLAAKTRAELIRRIEPNIHNMIVSAVENEVHLENREPTQ